MVAHSPGPLMDFSGLLHSREANPKDMGPDDLRGTMKFMIISLWSRTYIQRNCNITASSGVTLTWVAFAIDLGGRLYQWSPSIFLCAPCNPCEFWVTLCIFHAVSRIPSSFQILFLLACRLFQEERAMSYQFEVTIEDSFEKKLTVIRGILRF